MTYYFRNVNTLMCLKFEVFIKALLDHITMYLKFDLSVIFCRYTNQSKQAQVGIINYFREKYVYNYMCGNNKNNEIQYKLFHRISFKIRIFNVYIKI